MLMLLKKIAGWALLGDIWPLYLLLRVHNQFVEGSSKAYVMLNLFRNLPRYDPSIHIGYSGRGGKLSSASAQEKQANGLWSVTTAAASTTLM